MVSEKFKLLIFVLYITILVYWTDLIKKGKKILVTGAGGGIGRGIAVALAKSGCKVYALSRNAETLKTLQAEYPDIATIVADIADWDNTKKELEKLDALDGVVNNAAIVTQSEALETTKADLEKCFSVNTMAAVNIIQIVCKKMIEEKKPGSIVNISSIGGLKAFPNVLTYTVSKAGLDMVSKQFALELGPHNIRVNTVHPGFVLTDMTKSIIASGNPIDKKASERTPMPRLQEVEEIVGPVLYLLSDQSAMVTGTQHVVDGGLMCNITTKA